MNMKGKKLAIPAFFMAIAVFSGCFSPWKGDEATITLSFGGANSSTAARNINEDQIKLLDHKVEFSGPAGVQIFDFEKETTTAQFTVAPGHYDITVKAYVAPDDLDWMDLGGTDVGLEVFFDATEKKYLFYQGSYSGDIISGKNNQVDIPMKRAVPTLAAQLNWLKNNATAGGHYTLIVGANESIGPQIPFSVSSDDADPITIVLKGDGANRVVSLSSNGSMFTVGYRVTLDLINITLQGRENNSAPLVLVTNEGTLVMESGSVITGNKNTVGEGRGGGVFVRETGSLIMMEGTAEITGNEAVEGGGVFVSKLDETWTGHFTMYGGKITKNTAVQGGGVRAVTGFTMSGGEISNNTSNQDGGGVYVSGGNNVTFAMTETARISGNNAGQSGGGVYVCDQATLNMYGGARISGNTAYADGGGVNVFQGCFNMMYGGEISSNTAYSAGGGVHLNGTFNKEDGGIIYGYDPDNPLSNKAVWDGGPAINSGHAVYAWGFFANNEHFIRRRETTIDYNENMFTYNGVESVTGTWDQ